MENILRTRKGGHYKKNIWFLLKNGGRCDPWIVNIIWDYLDFFLLPAHFKYRGCIITASYDNIWSKAYKGRKGQRPY